MTRSAEVALALLDSHFRITSADGRMLAFVQELWAPFVVPNAPAEATPVVVEAEGAGWRVDLPGDPGGASDDPWVLAAVLRNSLSRRAVADASTVPLHGAAVERDGVFVVLSGPVRAGKTTLLLALLERGWRLVTDDLVPVDPGDLTSSRFLKPLSVRDPERWRRSVGGWRAPAWLPPPAAVGLIPATAFPVVEGGPFRPSLLVFARFAGGRGPVAEPLTAARTVAACAENVHPAAAPSAHALAVLARLGSSTPGFSMRYGSTEVALELLGNRLAGGIPME